MLRNDLYTPWFYEEKWGFEIITGEFQGIVIQIEKIEFIKDNIDELDMVYHIINKPQEFEKTTIFEETLNIVINDILKEAIGHYESSRTDNPEESGA
jgi:hypothetical protein